MKFLIETFTLPYCKSLLARADYNVDVVIYGRREQKVENARILRIKNYTESRKYSYHLFLDCQLRTIPIVPEYEFQNFQR